MNHLPAIKNLKNGGRKGSDEHKQRAYEYDGNNGLNNVKKSGKLSNEISL